MSNHKWTVNTQNYWKSKFQRSHQDRGQVDLLSTKTPSLMSFSSSLSWATKKKQTRWRSEWTSARENVSGTFNLHLAGLGPRCVTRLPRDSPSMTAPPSHWMFTKSLLLSFNNRHCLTKFNSWLAVAALMETSTRHQQTWTLSFLTARTQGGDWAHLTLIMLIVVSLHGLASWLCPSGTEHPIKKLLSLKQTGRPL